MGRLLSTQELGELISELYKRCNISLEGFNQLSPVNQLAVLNWTRNELNRKQQVISNLEQIKTALKQFGAQLKSNN